MQFQIKARTPIIFLDVDGVLNSIMYRSSQAGAALLEECIDPESIKHLLKIVENTNADIVASTSWRMQNSHMQVLYKMLHKHSNGKIKTVGMTKVGCEMCCRGNEIRQWLIEHRGETFNQYVIIDDDIDILYAQSGHMVQVNSTVGITNTDADKCIGILNHYKNIETR